MENKKYFVVSDIHSFCSELKYSLRQVGFNKRNKNHILIVCGDVFDRGDETIEVYKYLKSIPKKRCILIRGNHESLYKELFQDVDFKPLSYYSMKTVKYNVQQMQFTKELINKAYEYVQENKNKNIIKSLDDIL